MATYICLDCKCVFGVAHGSEVSGTPIEADHTSATIATGNILEGVKAEE